MLNSSSTTRLLELARQRRECLLRVRRYGEGQLALIEQGDMGRLLSLLADKSRELETLKQINGQLAPYRAAADGARHWDNPEDRSECRHLLSESEMLIQEIIAQEKESESRLQAHRTDVGHQLQSSHLSQFASNAYQTQARNNGRLDLSSGS